MLPPSPTPSRWQACTHSISMDFPENSSVLFKPLSGEGPCERKFCYPRKQHNTTIWSGNETWPRDPAQTTTPIGLPLVQINKKENVQGLNSELSWTLTTDFQQGTRRISSKYSPKVNTNPILYSLINDEKSWAAIGDIKIYFDRKCIQLKVMTYGPSALRVENFKNLFQPE